MPAQTVDEKAPFESVTTTKEGTEARPKSENDTKSPGTTPVHNTVNSENETAQPVSKEMALETPKASDAPTDKAASGEEKLNPDVDDKTGPTKDGEPAPPSNALKSAVEVVSTGKKADIGKSEDGVKEESGADAVVIEKPAEENPKPPVLASEGKNGDDMMMVDKPIDGDEEKADTTKKPGVAEVPDASVEAPTLAEAETADKTENSDDNPKCTKVTFGAVEKVAIEEEDDEYEPNEGEDAEDDDDEEDGEIAEGDEPLLDLKSLPPAFTTSLLENGAINRPLHGPASKGNTDELRALLAKDGAMEGKVDDRDVYQYTALHVAVENDRLEACKLLLEHGADIEASTKMHESKPIHYAAIEGHDEVISFLLEQGANINALTDDNRTALYLAAMRGHDHCVKLLLEKGANRDLTDKDGKKPADVADKQAVVDLLISPPAKKART